MVLWNLKDVQFPPDEDGAMQDFCDLLVKVTLDQPGSRTILICVSFVFKNLHRKPFVKEVGTRTINW